MIIRIATPQDAPEVQKIYTPYVLNTAISFETEVPSANEMRNRIEASLERHVWLLAEENGRALGYAYAARHHVRPAYQWSADVSVYLEQSAQGKGLGKKLYRILLELISLQGYYQCFAGITLPNEKSRRLHESFGFSFIGRYSNAGYKHGSWYDVGWWEKSLREPVLNPPPTLPLSALKQTRISALLNGETTEPI